MLSKVHLAWAWTLLILILCWFPRAYMPVNEHAPRAFFVPNLDKLVHLVIFFGFSFLWSRAVTWKFRGWLILTLGLSLAIMTEVGQTSRLVNRDGSVGDALADAAGVILGLIAEVVVRKVQEKRAARVTR